MADGFSRRSFLAGAALALAHSYIPSAFGSVGSGTGPGLSRSPFRPQSSGDPFTAPVGAAATTVSRAAAVTGPGVASGATTLVLYDTTGPYGWLGELYGIMTANLVSHFGGWTAAPVTSYVAGQMSQFSAVVYVGSTYDEPLPVPFLDDVLNGTRPVVWLYDNIWQLTNRWATLNPGGGFATSYGWMWSSFDTSTVAEVVYKGTSLRRYSANGAGILNYSTFDPSVVLAYAVRSDGSSFPWAVRSRNLTYVGENAFVYMLEGDRVLAFEDLLFDALAPGTAEGHRALVRFEDISPADDPASIRAAGDYLASRDVPFGFGVITEYKDPLGVYDNGVPQDIRLRRSPEIASALEYLRQRGGVMVEHGWTHQYSNVANPYNGVSGDDFEFYRVTENLDHTLNYVGPVPNDSRNFALQRVSSAAREFQAVNLPVPTIFEFPHYAASATDYRAIAERFSTRWERALYFRGLLSGGAIDHSRVAGQRFSYVVRDVYGTKVLPENLGSVEPEPFFQFPTRFPADILGDAARVRVVRDGFAAFYFHPFLDLDYLKQIVEGLQSTGWTFVSPSSL